MCQINSQSSPTFLEPCSTYPRYFPLNPRKLRGKAKTSRTQVSRRRKGSTSGENSSGPSGGRFNAMLRPRVQVNSTNDNYSNAMIIRIENYSNTYNTMWPCVFVNTVISACVGPHTENFARLEIWQLFPTPYIIFRTQLFLRVF